MQKEQTSTLLVNVLTGLVVVGVLVGAFIVFTKKDTTITTGTDAQSVSVAQVAQETAQIGAEIDATVRDLGELSNAVASSKVIFELPEFKNLEDYSVVIPAESVGRTNPFVPTAWKIKMKALEASAGKSATQASAPATSQTNQQSASVSGTQTQGSSNSLFTDFTSGI